MAFNKLSKQYQEMKGYGKSTNLKVMPQTGKIKSINRDIGRTASLPGKRISRTGNVYWETRKNRTDTSYGMT